MVGSKYAPDTRRVWDYATRNRRPYRWLGLETDPSAEDLLAQFGLTRSTPPVVIVHGRLLCNPDYAELAALIGLPGPTAPQAHRRRTEGRAPGNGTRIRPRRLLI
jgi:thioredoxin reductase (NADPH)